MVQLDDDPREAIETLRRRVRTGERDVSDADAEAILAFSDRLDLLATEYSDFRHLKLLRHAVIMAENVGDLHKVPTDREAVEAVVRWINRTYDNEETNRDYRSALRVFGKRLYEGDADYPPSVSWVPTGTSSSYDPAPDPSEMLWWDEDVKPMIDAATCSRDQAFIALQFDAGLRSGELFELTVGDVSDAEHGLRIFVDGKTGQRSIGLIPSVPYVNRWLSDHPARSDPDAPLWAKLDQPEAPTYQYFLDRLKDIARKAGVDKPVTPTNFRRSNTAWLATQGANNALIEDRQGRERGSEHVARYLARFGEDWDAQYAQMHGLEIAEDETDDGLAPITCPRCDRETPHDEPACVWCGQALTPAATDAKDELDAALTESVFEAARSGELTVEDMEAIRTVIEDPDVLQELLGVVLEDHTSAPPSR